MRIVGMFLLGFGIMFLIMAGFFFANPPGVPGAMICMVGWLACVTVPMIIGGIAMIRKAESQRISDDIAAPETWAGENDVIETPTIKSWNPFHVLHQVQTFDLSRLNWIGWLLLLGSFAFAFGGVAVVTLLLGDFAAKHPAGRFLAYGVIFLAIGFFFAVRWLLRRFGINIYRQ